MVADDLAEGYNDIEQAVSTFQEFIIHGLFHQTLENIKNKAYKYMTAKRKKMPITDKDIIMFDKLVRSSVCCFGEGFVSGAFTDQF